MHDFRSWDSGCPRTTREEGAGVGLLVLRKLTFLIWVLVSQCVHFVNLH